jgi:hypothetical protein
MVSRPFLFNFLWSDGRKKGAVTPGRSLKDTPSQLDRLTGGLTA